jgi:two-component system chemotaxis response regulator CheB
MRRVLERDPQLQVVGEAGDGKTGVAAAAKLRPDVIVMDVRMPEMDGLAATREIMRRAAVPIVLVTAGHGASEVDMSFAALEAGALAIVDKPGGCTGNEWEAQIEGFVDTVKLMAEVRVVGRRFEEGDRSRRESVLRTIETSDIGVVGIAASTGGPAALATILRALPVDLPVPILVVQHIGPGFDEGLVNWLLAGSPVPVGLAVAGSRLRPGEVVVCPHDRHLGVSSDMRVVLSDSDPIRGHRPSATYLFRAIARLQNVRALGVILTGMGEDGVEGLVELKGADGVVVAQDEESSVVYGMPARAVELGLADAVLPVEKIAAAVASVTANRSLRRA